MRYVNLLIGHVSFCATLVSFSPSAWFSHIDGGSAQRCNKNMDKDIIQNTDKNVNKNVVHDRNLNLNQNIHQNDDENDMNKNEISTEINSINNSMDSNDHIDELDDIFNGNIIDNMNDMNAVKNTGNIVCL